MQRAEDTRGLIVLIRSPNTLYIYILYIYTVMYIYNHTCISHHTITVYTYCIYILYHTCISNHTMEWHEAFRPPTTTWSSRVLFADPVHANTLLQASREALGIRDTAAMYIYRTLAWNQAIDLVGWNAYMVWVIFLAIYPSGYIPFQPAHPL